jgi:hypothetical protein
MAWESLPQSKGLECHIFGFLVLYLSQVCLQFLSRVSGSGAHKIFSSVSIAILDLPSLGLLQLISIVLQTVLGCARDFVSRYLKII